MLRLGKDIALLCEICHKPIAVSRIRIHPKAVTCGRPQCNQSGRSKAPLGKNHKGLCGNNRHTGGPTIETAAGLNRYRRLTPAMLADKIKV